MARNVNWGKWRWELQLDGGYKPYDENEDRVLKQAYDSGQNVVRYSTRGQEYEVSFKSFTQINLATRKVRRVRHRALTKKPPAQAKMAAGGAPAPAAPIAGAAPAPAAP